MKKLRQIYLGYLSLLFLLLSSVGLAQTNENPLDISLKDYYYETKNIGGENNKAGEFLIVHKLNSSKARIVTQPEKTIKMFLNMGGIWTGGKKSFGAISSEERNLMIVNEQISPVISQDLNSNIGKWEFIPISGNIYNLYNFSKSEYLKFSGDTFGFSRNTNNNSGDFKWYIDDSNTSLKSNQYSKFINYKTIEGFDSRTGGILGSIFPISETEFFMDESSSNLRVFKRLRMNGVVNKSVNVGENETLFNTTETGARVTYQIIYQSMPNIARIAGGKIYYENEGLIKLKAIAEAREHIPSYTKTVTINIVGRQTTEECFNDNFSVINIEGSKFSYDTSRNSIPTFNNGIVTLKNDAAIKSIKLPEVFGNSVTVRMRVAGRNSDKNIRPLVKVTFLHTNQNFNKTPIIEDIVNSRTGALSYQQIEFVFTQVEENSFIQVDLGNDSEIFIDQLDIQCVESELNIWENGKWSKLHPPTIVDRAEIREPIDQNVTARNLTIKTNLVVPEGRIFTVDNELIIDKNLQQEDYNLKFSKGAYLYLGKNASVNKEIEFETKSDFYYWDTRMVSSPVSSQRFIDVFGQRKGLTSSSDYAISEFVLAENVSYGENTDYTGTFIPSDIEYMEVGRAYALQRYRNNGVRLGRYGDQGAIKTPFLNIFKGIPNNEDISLTVYNPQGELNYNGSYAVGNPYTAPLNIFEFLEDNNQINYIEVYKNNNHYNFQTRSYVEDNRYFWYVCNRDGICGEEDTNNIDVGVGFIVMYKANNLTAEDYVINFKREQITSNLDYTFQNRENIAEPSYLKIQLFKNEEKIGQPVVLGYSESCSNDYDYGYDIEDRYNNEGVKIVNNNLNLLMDFKGYPFLEDHKFPLKINLLEEGIYELNAFSVKGIFENNQNYYLYDRYLNIYIDLKNNNSYTFNSEDYNLENRFEIVFKNVLLETNDLVNEDFKIYRIENLFRVESIKNVVNYQVYDLTGSNYLNITINDNKFDIVGLNKGVSLIKFNLEDGTSINKKVLK